MLFLGEASNLRGNTLRHIFAFGTQNDSRALISELSRRYKAPTSNIALTANGRSALCLAIKALIPKGSEVVLNGFTCHAVVVAIKAAGCTPVFADIEEETLNFTPQTLKNLLKSHKNIKGFILQNTLGNPINIRPFEQIAKEHNLAIIEDLAHCTGVFYPDGREVGSVGDAAALSFGKGKSLDTITGGALVLKNPQKPLKNPQKRQKLSQTLRARFYPLFGSLLRASFRIHLNAPLAWLLLKLHLIERSADAPLNLNSRLTHWQAKLALRQLQSLPPQGRSPLRDFALVKNREKLLAKWQKSGFIFDELWYDTPVSPARYYQKSGFDETLCPHATEVAQQIVNLPTWYNKSALAPALKILKEHQHGKMD